MFRKDTAAIFFDLDGTLVDTENLGIRALDHLLTNLGTPLLEANHKDFIEAWLASGTWLPVELQLDKIYNSFPHSITLESFKNQFFDEYQRQIRSAQILPGMDKLVRSCSSQFPIGLVTGSGRRQTAEILSLNNWEQLFSIQITQDDVTNGKPSGEPYLLAANRLQVLPENSIAIENSPIGIRAACAAGMFTIGIHKGNPSRHDLSEANIEFESGEQLLLESLNTVF
jgi:HAD superfamily hydrolase (TIGR01509 family)